MVLLTSFEATPVAEYLRREAPRELERLKSIDRLVSSWPEGSTPDLASPHLLHTTDGG